jgi:antitoxin MazE
MSHEIRTKRVKIRPIAPHAVRSGWDRAFAAMAAAGDDQLLDAPTATEWDHTEWEMNSEKSWTN